MDQSINQSTVPMHFRLISVDHHHFLLFFSLFRHNYKSRVFLKQFPHLCVLINGRKGFQKDVPVRCDPQRPGRMIPLQIHLFPIILRAKLVIRTVQDHGLRLLARDSQRGVIPFIPRGRSSGWRCRRALSSLPSSKIVIFLVVIVAAAVPTASTADWALVIIHIVVETRHGETRQLFVRIIGPSPFGTSTAPAGGFGRCCLLRLSHRSCRGKA